MIQGKIPLRELERAPVEASFQTSDTWVQSFLLKAAPGFPSTDLKAEDWKTRSTVSGRVKLEKLNPEIMVEGSFSARVPVLCGRCGERGSVLREASFRLFYKPLERNEDPEAYESDPDYQYLEGMEIDLEQLFSEQLICAESMVEKPDQNEDGSKHKCLDNNILAGQGPENERVSPFSKLKELKGKLKE